MSIKSLVANPMIDSKELAYVLFPSNIHPKKALSRVCNGNKTLNKEQLERLAIYLGVPVNLLFSSTDWTKFVRSKAVSFQLKNKLVLIHLEENKGYVFNGREEPKFFQLDSKNALLKAVHFIETKF